MFLDNLLPNFTAVIAAPLCFVKRVRFPTMVSFGLLANLSKMRDKNVISKIDSIWDIGANHGQFAFMAHSVWPALPIYSFEPDPNSYHKLQENFKKFSFTGKTFCYALSDKVESKQFYCYDDNVNNSLLESNSHVSGAVNEFRTVDCTTLDSVARNYPEVTSAFLKLDVQGFELAVLAGSTIFLKQCLYVQIEVSFSPTYIGGAHAGEIILAMRQYGFECIDILD
ncbi:MAG TPA: FkbM family methyltransferase, partial [Methylophaga sp.]|nr:FkbM family methyltransferase [Methylophaga sp.]